MNTAHSTGEQDLINELPLNTEALREKFSQIESQPTQTRKLLKIGELAVVTHTTTRTLRYYEEMNLLRPVRNSSGQRLYSENAVARLNFINELKSGGFSLSEIKSLFDSWTSNQTGDQAAGATMNIIQLKLTEIADLQKRLAKLNDELRAMFSYMEGCKSCDEQPNEESCGSCDKHSEEDPNKLIMTILKKD